MKRKEDEIMSSDLMEDEDFPEKRSRRAGTANTAGRGRSRRREPEEGDTDILYGEEEREMPEERRRSRSPLSSVLLGKPALLASLAILLAGGLFYFWNTGSGTEKGWKEERRAGAWERGERMPGRDQTYNAGYDKGGRAEGKWDGRSARGTRDGMGARREAVYDAGERGAEERGVSGKERREFYGRDMPGPSFFPAEGLLKEKREGVKKTQEEERAFGGEYGEAGSPLSHKEDGRREKAHESRERREGRLTAATEKERGQKDTSPKSSEKGEALQGQGLTPPPVSATERNIYGMSRALLELDNRMTSLEEEQRALNAKLEGLRETNGKKGVALQEEGEKTLETLGKTGGKTEKSDLTAGASGKKKAIDNWTIVGFSGRRVVIKDRQGSHFLHVGETLDNVRITGIDVNTGSIRTSEGTVRYR
ncbi:MAG: hypothetical protein K5657_06575 [Desulfovibrio sp.]|nr:hypothetical protein [Desulfovibrio sp.]